VVVIFDQLLQDYGAVTYEAFINLLVDITEDQTSPDQLREAFRGIAGDKVRSSCMWARLPLLTRWSALCHRARPPPRPAAGERNRLPPGSRALSSQRGRRAHVRLRGVAG
jgi:hypothetical protein